MELEPLKRDEFDIHLKNNTLRLVFIGMSNSGKSYRAKLFEKDLGFFRYDVDAHIAKKLGLKDVDEVASWMGGLGSDSYKEKEKKYMQLENECTLAPGLDTGNRNLVFDTTGSVIYLDEKVIEFLRNDTLIVNFDVGEDSLQEMLEKYVEHPKPVFWDGLLDKKENESELDALKRCYPTLLKSRLKKYRELAHINIPVKEVYDKPANEILSIIRNYL